MRKELDELVESLTSALGEGLTSVVLYGPACGGSETVQPEEIQILILCKKLGVNELQALSKPLNRWMKRRHPIPKLFTRERLQKSTDVFPIECLEIKARHEVLYGESIEEVIKVDDTNLRLQLETEFKGKLLQLRESFILLNGKSKELSKMMALSLGAFEGLFRALGCLLAEDPSQTLLHLLKNIEGKLDLKLEVFNTLNQLRTDPGFVAGEAVLDLFGNYLTTMEQISDKVDAMES